MDERSTWLRDRVIEVLAIRLTVAALAATGITALGLLRLGLDPATVIPWALLVGHSTVATLVVIELLAGPSRPQDLRHYLLSHEGYALDRYQRPVDDDEQPSAGGDVAATLATVGLEPTRTVIDVAAEVEVYDLYQVSGRQLTAVVGRLSGDLFLVSTMTDASVVVTSQRFVATDQHVDLSFHPAADHLELIGRHLSRLDELVSLGLRCRRHDPTTILQILDSETAAWHQLGPWLGSVLRLDAGRGRRFRPSVVGVGVNNRLVSEAGRRVGCRRCGCPAHFLKVELHGDDGANTAGPTARPCRRS